MGFINELKKEHRQIIKRFNEICSIEDCKAPPTKINSLKKLLASHLKKEDTKLYPKLLNSEHEELQHLGKVFSRLMKQYSDEALAALDEYVAAKGKTKTDAASKRLKKISRKIKDRVIIEEYTLFPAYIKFFKD